MKKQARTRILLLILIAQAILVWVLLGPPAPPEDREGRGAIDLAAQVALPERAQRSSATRPARPRPSAPSRIGVPDTKPSEHRVVQKLGFDAPTLNDWEEKIFRGRTDYKLVSDERTGTHLLRASSSAASSGLYNKFEYDVVPGLKLSWQWRATSFPKKKHPEKLADRSQDDFAARVYAIFPGASFFKTDVIEYIWDESLPVGTLESSPFSSRVKLFVIRSGPLASADGSAPELVQEERDLYEDYLRIFGQAPKKKFGAIALMSDSDNTGTATAADFAEVMIKQSLGQPRLVEAPGADRPKNNFSADIDKGEDE